MPKEPSKSRRYGKLAGYLFLLAGALMIVPGLFFEGAQSANSGVGAMFLIFGIVFIARKNRRTPD